MALNSIASRLTPSAPTQITFGAFPTATGRKFATLFGHVAASGVTATPYQVYVVQNVGSPSAAYAEVAALAGVNSEIALMAQAFVQANASGGYGQFPAFRVVMLPNGVSNFGPNQEALTAVNLLRSDLLVSCYPAEDTVNQPVLSAFAVTISGIDRNLNGQFRTTVVFASLAPAAAQEAFNINSPNSLVNGMPDSNTAAVSAIGSVTSGSAILTAVSRAAISVVGSVTTGSTSIANVSPTANLYVGATITGTGIPANTTIEQILGENLVISNPATATATGETLSVVNLPTAGIYPGAQISGTGIPANTTVLSVQANTLTMSATATATGASESIAIQNMVSQPVAILAAASAGVLLATPFPYNPNTNVTIGGIIPPQKSSDWVAVDPSGTSEALLQAGISPLSVQNGSTVIYLRSRTTWTMNGTEPVTAYFDWADLVTLYDYAEDVFNVSQSPPFNNNPGGTKNSTTIAKLFKDELVRLAKQYEDNNAFQDVAQLAPLFQAQPNATDRGRMDWYVPADVLPGLYVIAGNIQAISTLQGLLQGTV